MASAVQDLATPPCAQTLRDALAASDEWSKLRPSSLTEQRRKIAALREKIHEATKPSFRGESQDPSGALSDEEDALGADVRALDEANKQLKRERATWKDQRRRLRARFVRDVTSHLESLRTRFGSQGLNISFTVSDSELERGASVGDAQSPIIGSNAGDGDTAVAPVAPTIAAGIEPASVADVSDTPEGPSVAAPEQPRPARRQSITCSPPVPQSGAARLSTASPSTDRRIQPETPARVVTQPGTPETRKRPAEAALSEAAQRKRQRLARRVIEFDDVYQNGEGEHRYNIVHQSFSHPSKATLTGDFWILRCETHNTHYSSDRGAKGAISSAAKHVSAHRAQGSHQVSGNKSRTKALEKFGVLVKNCTKELADKNNEKVIAAIVRNEYVPETKMQPPTGESGDMSSSDDPIEISDDDDSPAQVSTSHPGPLPAISPITDPKPGELYTVFWSGGRIGHRKKPYAGLMLPFGSFKELGLHGSFSSCELAKTVPGCYLSRDVHAGWRPPYRDGGTSVKERRFPFLCFNNENGIEECGYAWIKAEDVRLFDLDTTVEKYRSVVEEYQKREMPVAETIEGNSVNEEDATLLDQYLSAEDDADSHQTDANRDRTAATDRAVPSTRTSITIDHPRRTQYSEDLDAARAAFQVAAEANFSQSTLAHSSGSVADPSDRGDPSEDHVAPGNREATPLAPFPRMHSSTPMPQSFSGDLISRATLLEPARHRPELQQVQPRADSLDRRAQSPLSSSRNASNQLRTPDQTPQKASSERSSKTTSPSRGEASIDSRSGKNIRRTRPYWQQSETHLRRRAQDK